MPAKLEIPQIACTAAHEAGHAVVAWLQGLFVKSVEVTGTFSGMMSLSGRHHLRYSKFQWHRMNAATAISGPVAEHIAFSKAAGFFGEPLRPAEVISHIHGNDERNVIRYAKQSRDRDESRQRVAGLMRRVHEVLSRPDVWSIIEDLSAELLARGKLQGTELEPFRERVDVVRETVAI